MKLLIFGATGGTGKELVRQGLEQGHQITVYARNPSAANDSRISTIQGTLDDQEKLQRAMVGQDAVISALGNKTSSALWRKNTAISEGLSNIMRAMEAAHVQRILFITSFGVNEKIFFPEKLFIKIFLGNIFADIPRQELLLRESDLQWTIVRPARLVHGPWTGRYRSGEHLPIGLSSSISRADVADFILKNVRNPNTIGKIITVTY